MHRHLVVGNWKMHGSKASIEDLIGRVKTALGEHHGLSIVVCPPYLFIPQVVEALLGTGIRCGAQNSGESVEGAYTGEISAPMLAECGCQYVIIGH